MPSISSRPSISMVWRQPERATLVKWMICGTIAESEASRTRRTSSRCPGMKRSSPSRSSGPERLACTAVASTTISPTRPSA